MNDSDRCNEKTFAGIWSVTPRKIILFEVFKWWLSLMMLSSFFLVPVPSAAQAINLDYEKIQVGDVQNHLCWLALSPDGKTIAISSMQSYPFYLYDWQDKKLLKSIDIGEWYAGARVSYSRTGKYLLFQQLYFMDYAPNKDREVNFEITDANNGAEIINFCNYHSVDITPDENYAVTLSGDDVSFWNLATGDKERSFNVPDASNSAAVSTDGKLVAVSHRPWKDELKKNPMYVNNKKNQGNLEKYK
jgi:Tol biopolymer transport system component